MSMNVLFCSEADEARKLRQEEQRKLNGSGDGGCPGANGWSLPPKCHTATAADSSTGQTSIPIPVFCRPVTEAPSVQVTFLSFCMFVLFSVSFSKAVYTSSF